VTDSQCYRFSRIFVLILTFCVVMSTVTPSVHAQSGAATNFSKRELIRNGDFSLKKVAWHVDGENSFDYDKGNPGYAMLLGSVISYGQGRGDAFQELHMPDTVTSANILFEYRYGQGPEPRIINTFAVLLLAMNGEEWETLATAYHVQNENVPDDKWWERTYKLGADEVNAVNAAHKAGKRIFYYFMFDGRNTSVYLDNVSFTVDGSMDPIQSTGEIAYLKWDDKGKPRHIHRMKPDSSADQNLWTHPNTQIDQAEPVLNNIRWMPDATGISFISNYDEFYSSHVDDVYVIYPDGSNIRRITNMPSPEELKRGGFATGTVTGEIVNTSGLESYQISPMLVYVQGAPAPTPINPPRRFESVKFTVHNVADLGPNVRQRVTVIWSEAVSGKYGCVNGREFMVAMNADVVAGQTIDAGSANFTGQCHKFHIRKHTWKPDSSAIGYIDSVAAASEIKAKGEATGRDLLSGISTVDLAWSPVNESLLYMRAEDGSGLWLSPDGKSAGTQALVKSEGAEDPVWLPDGSGFIYAQGALFLAEVGGERMQITPEFFNEAAARPSIAPDGRYVIYERQGLEITFMGTSVLSRNLWVVDLQNPMRTWPLTTDGKSGNPAWSQREPSNPSSGNPGGGNPGEGNPDPVDPKNRIYLPALSR
jgi:hypothetical protein